MQSGELVPHPESRDQLVTRLVDRFDYAYGMDRYGPKLLRIVLGVLSDDTLEMMDSYFSGSSSDLEMITRVIDTHTEEELREYIMFHDDFGVHDPEVVSRLLAEMHRNPRLSGVSDFTKLDSNGRKSVHALCTVLGAVHRATHNAGALPDDDYLMPPRLFHFLFSHPEQAKGVAELILNHHGVRLETAEDLSKFLNTKSMQQP